MKDKRRHRHQRKRENGSNTKDLKEKRGAEGQLRKQRSIKSKKEEELGKERC